MSASCEAITGTGTAAAAGTPVVTVTGVGSWPGEDPLEAQRTVLGELGAVDGEARGLPFLVELPARGPGADLVGRTAALLVDLPVDLQPSGWRFTDAPGRDHARAVSHLRADLDALAEAADGYTGPVKVQVAGPWTLAASVRLPRGERSVADPGARRDVVDSLAEGIAQHVAQVRRLVPDADVVVQLDEPLLPAVLAGELRTDSGLGRLAAVEAPHAQTALGTVLAAATAAGATATVVHCCAPGVPFPVLRGSGAGAVAVDVATLTVTDWESVAVAVEDGQDLWAGVLRTDPAAPPPGTPADLAAAVSTPWRRVGLPAADLARVVLTPACGLAGASPATARDALARLVGAARRLTTTALG